MPSIRPARQRKASALRGGTACWSNTARPAPSVCDKGKNGFYVVDAASLLPTLIRALDPIEEVIADDGAATNHSATAARCPWSLELFSADIAAALVDGDFSIADDRYSGRTLMPAETCQASIAQERAGTDRRARLTINAEPASAATAVDITGRAKRCPFRHRTSPLRTRAEADSFHFICQ